MTEAVTVPEARGFIFFDPKKCVGCKSCMLACSLAHEGKENLSLSRIQILDDPFGQYPTDLSIEVCRQCKHPLCAEACSVGAFYVDEKHMNVRTIDEAKCVGCKLCIAACPFTPSMAIWNHETRKAVKCDLCRDTPNWKEKGKLACVETCPVRALKFSAKAPRVSGREGYIVNLRGEGWKRLGLSANQQEGKQ